MKKFIVTSLIFITTLSLIHCSGAKVLNSWKSESIADVKDNNMLVIARTNNKSARIAFENEIVKNLKTKGMNATASFEKFPKLNPDQKISKEDEKKIKSLLLESGFNGVVLTIIKEEQELTKTVSDGGYYAGGNYYGYYPRYYNGFFGYYSNPMSYATLGNYVEKTTTTFTAKNFILETVIYNLDEPDEKQLVAVVTTKLEQPDNAAIIAKQYAKAVSKSFAK